MEIRLPPATRYQGSKRKLLTWIDECVGDRPITSILDLMAGTASVAYYFKSKGWRVGANDYLKCNYLSALALVENRSTLLTDDDVDWLLDDADDDSAKFVSDTFGGFFFTDEENEWLDHRLGRLASMESRYAGATLTFKQAIAFHCLAQAALMKRPFNLFHRKNLYLRTSDVQRSFGNKTTWDTEFAELFRRHVRRTNEAIFDNGKANVAHHAPAESLLVQENYDAVYLDPPYFAEGRELARSDYRFLYHFLEGMANYETWGSLVDRNDIRLALKRDYNERSPYRAPRSELADSLLEWFRAVLSPWAESTIVMSYKFPGTPTLKQLRDLLGDLKSRVTIYARPYTYALNKKNGTPKENIEVLLIGE